MELLVVQFINHSNLLWRGIGWLFDMYVVAEGGIACPNNEPTVTDLKMLSAKAN